MKFTNILVQATNAAAGSNDPAVRTARKLAQRFRARITLFDVISDVSWALQYVVGSWEQTIENVSGAKQKRLRETAEALVDEGLEAEYVLATGRLSTAIENQVRMGQHDLVVKVAEGESGNRSGFLGSTDIRLVRECRCPVLILHQESDGGFRDVAIAVDVLDDHETQRDLDAQSIHAAMAVSDAPLTLVYALTDMHEAIRVDTPDRDLVTSEQLAQWNHELTAAAEEKLESLLQAIDGRQRSCFVLQGRPEKAIPEFVNGRGNDLLVMGSVGRSGLDGLLMGNTTERVLECVDCSVLVVPPTAQGD